jgi:predicted phage tail protein
MFKKFLGILVICIFIGGLIPSSSFAEKQQVSVIDLMATKNLDDFTKLMGDENNVSIQINNSNTLYNYIGNTLGTDITIAEYIHLMDVMQNQTTKLGGYEFYLAYATAPDDVYINNVCNDTPRNLLSKVPYFSVTKNSWDEIIKKYGCMSLDERIDYLNTIVPNTDNVLNLYKNSDDNCAMFMFNEAGSAFDDISNIDFDHNGAWYMGHTEAAKEMSGQLNNIVNDFNVKSVHAYNKYNIYGTNLNITQDNINASLDNLYAAKSKLTTVRNVFDSVGPTLTTVVGVLIGFGVYLFVMGCVFSPAEWAAAILILAVGAVMIGLGVTMMALLATVVPLLAIVDSNIKTLEEYRDSLNL